MIRKILFLACILFPLVLLLSTHALAAVFYVDNSGSPVCSNSSSNGSEARPWCTINYGVSRLSSGDTLYVKRGTYNEVVYIAGPSGTASKPTIVQAFPGHTPIIRGSGYSGSGRVKIANASYITFDGFEITSFNQGLFVENSHHIVVQNTHVHHVGQEAIHVLYNSSFVTVQNNTIHDTRQWDYNGEGVYVGTGSGGPSDNTNNVIVRNNTIYNTTDEAIELKAGTHDCVVEGNNISRASTGSGVGAIEVNQHTGGAQNWGANPNHIIRNNVVYDTDTAINVDTGSLVYNNVIYNIASSSYGILVSRSAGDSYARNIYHNTVDLPTSRAIVNPNGANVDIRNNIGPSTTRNLATSDAFYVSKARADYRLVPGSSPIGAGADLTAVVSVDIDGNNRLASGPPDIGAYEYTNVSAPNAPSDLKVLP